MPAAFLLMSIAVRAQTPQEQSSQESVPQPALEAKLGVHLSKACSGSYVLLTLELTNISQEEIRINKQELWSDLSYRNLSKPGNIISQSSCFGRDPDSKENEIVLEPGAKYYGVFNFPLKDDYFSFFSAPNTYAISTYVSYHGSDKFDGSVRSNEAQFEIQECKSQ